MLRVIRQNVNRFKYPRNAALTLSFASFGDAFLYPFLPQYAQEMNIPVVSIGILLSVNRFTRIVFNRLILELFAIYGIRKLTIAASIAAILSTVGYGLEIGIYPLIFFRIIWGLAFAVLRISSIAYSLEQEAVGFSLGISKAIQDAGPLLALWLGPIILEHMSINHTFFVLALISIPSLLYALSLPDLKYCSISSKTVNFKLPSLLNTMTFISSFLVEGFLVIVIGLFITTYNPSLSNLAIMTMAAGYLAYRRICALFFAPVSGALADRVGFSGVFNFAMLMTIVGLVLLLVGLVPIGLILTFTFNSVIGTITPGDVSQEQNDKIKAVSLNAYWRDIGAASGTLLGGLLLMNGAVSEIFTFGIFILTILLTFRYRKIEKR